MIWLRSTALAVLIAGLPIGASEAKITIGVGGPMTGPEAVLGDELKAGVQQAVEDINAAGGILGETVVLTYGDDRADPKEGVSVANRFAASGLKFVVGHFNSGVAIPASDVYLENGMLLITPAATNPLVTDRRGMWNVFRVCGRDDQQGAVAGAYIARAFARGRVAMVHDKTTYGLGLADQTRKAMIANGISPVMYEGVNKEEKDLTALVSKIKEFSPDLVFWGGSHSIGGLILRQMRDQGLRSSMMSGDGIADDEFAAIAGPGAEGTLMTFAPDPRNNPVNREIVEAYRRKRGFDPEGYTLYSYASVQVLKQAAEFAKSLDPKRMADVMHSGHVFRTVLGDIEFDAKGDVSDRGYQVDGKKKDRFVLYTWRKTPSGKITYFENE